MAKNSFEIRLAGEQDWAEIWQMFHSVVSAGDAYVYDPQTTQEQAKTIWFNSTQVYVAICDGKVLGSYIIKPNFPGLGSHVANCSYMVSEDARGMGLGRLLGEHSIVVAKDSGYQSMQFNIVVSTNAAAVKLWQALGFTIIGTSPKAFRHKTLGLVDTYIMHREID